MLPNPDKNIIDYMNKIIFSFLWNKKPSKLKQTTVIKQYGRLKLINIRAFMEALKLMLVRRLLTVDCKWQVFIKQYLQVEQLTGCNTKYLEKVILQLPNQFWKDVLQSLININKKVTFTEEDILKSPIYYNNNIKIGGLDIYYRSWFNKGIKYVNDLVNENGDFY